MTTDSVLRMENCQKTLGKSGDSVVQFGLAEFLVNRGEQIAVTGPSGCGKSTLLNLAAGLIRPDSGNVVVAGTDLGPLKESRIDQWRGRNVGYIQQSLNLLEPFTALENILISMRFGRTKAQKNAAVEKLERVGLTHRLHSKTKQLSMGERQRVAIARALVNKPALLLADEPTAALDPKTAETVFDLLMEICREEDCALVFVTHDHSLAERFPRRFQCDGLITSNESSSAAA